MKTLIPIAALFPQKVIGNLCLTVLLVLYVATPASGLYAYAVGVRTDPKAQPTESSVPTQPLASQPAKGIPDAPGQPFFRFITAMLIGLAQGFLNFKRNYQRFWKLGILSNLYSYAYIASGVFPTLVCFAFGQLPPLSSAVTNTQPWAIQLIGQSIWGVVQKFLTKGRSNNGAPDDLEYLNTPYKSNSFYAALDDGILQVVRRRLQKAVRLASERYSWSVIKIAAIQVINENRAISRNQKAVDEELEQFLKDLPDEVDPGLSSSVKYDTIYRILRNCEYRHFRQQLDIAELEASHETN